MTSSSGNTDLVETTDNTLTIPTLASGSYSSPSDFPANHWGYKKDSGSYIPFATNTTILESDTYANDDTTTLSFATKIDYLQASGTYKTTLVFTTTANPLTPYIQNLDPTLCTTTPLTVLDKRDGQEYLIQRLSDGNCWMIDNLRLDPTQVSLNDLKGNTNATDQTLTYLKNGGGSGQYPASGVVAKTASGGSWSNSYNLPYVYTGHKDAVDSIIYGVGSNKYGVLYNFCAVSAGSYCYASGSGSGNIEQDICPAGWKIPTGTTDNGSYYYLYTSGYNSNIANFREALSLPMSGSYDGTYGFSNSDSGGLFGDYWESTYYNGTSMYRLYNSINTSRFDTRSQYYRYYGFSIRCVLNDTRNISDITYMQDITPGIVSRTANNATATLTDKRDNQQYAVAKINGNVWMTRNLAIGCNGTGSTYGATATGIELTPATSNISGSNWTMPTTHLSTGDDFTTPKMACDTTYGARYNYAATSAETIVGTSTTVLDTYNICPAGWTLATEPQAVSVINYGPNFNMLTGGIYRGGVVDYTARGYWWTSQATDGVYRYTLSSNGSSLTTNTDYRIYRSDGAYVRCVAK